MSDAEWKQFLAKLYGGNANQLAGGIMQGLEPATPQPVPQGVMGTDSHELNHHIAAGVKTYNASGTIPMMMAGHIHQRKKQCTMVRFISVRIMGYKPINFPLPMFVDSLNSFQYLHI